MASANSPPALTQAKEVPMAQANGLSTPLSPSAADAKSDAFTAKSHPSTTALTFSAIHYKAVKDRLRSEDPTLDEETLADTVEGLTDLHEILSSIIRAALADEALVAGLKALIADMEDRRERLQNRAAKRRQIAKEAMAELDIKKLQAPDFTASLRPGMASLVVIDEAAVPSIYWEPRPPKLDRVGLLTDLKQGTDVS